LNIGIIMRRFAGNALKKHMNTQSLFYLQDDFFNA